MKTLLVIALLAVAGTSEAAMKTSPSKYTGDTAYSGFCKAVVNDDLALLKRNIVQKIGVISDSRKGVMRKLLSETGMTCNGMDLIRFSMQRDASEVYAYLSAKK